MVRRKASIRLRLTLWYSTVMLVGMAVFAGCMWVALERTLIRDVDEHLAQRVAGVRTVFEVEGPRERQALRGELAEFLQEVQDGIQVEIRDSAGAVFLASPAARASEYRTLVRTIECRGESYQVRAAAPLDSVRGVMRTFGTLLLAMIPAVLLAACLGGYWVSRRALAPVDEITRVARSISVHNLSRRLGVPQTGDELQRMSETWNEVLERLDGAVKRIRQFTADASHELRTPVALIRATAELALRRERRPEEYRSSLGEIQSEAERMTELTESLLLLARADAGGIDLPMKPMDLNAVAAEVVRQSEPLAEARGVQLSAAIEAPPAVVSANDAAVRRLLLILIDNALKHTPAGGTVTVSTAGSSVEVRDSGEGIEPEALPHIFERFYRADKARGGDGGAGLGLSIAQVIAHAHGTGVEVESAAGAGACFRVRFQEREGREPA